MIMKENTDILGKSFIVLVFLFVLLFASYSNGTQPQVATGSIHTVGLRSDGTVVAVGYNHSGQLRAYPKTLLPAVMIIVDETRSNRREERGWKESNLNV